MFNELEFISFLQAAFLQPMVADFQLLALGSFKACSSELFVMHAGVEPKTVIP